MRERKGEKIGWIAGWTGGFIWLALLSAVWLAQGKMRLATAGTGLVAIAMLFIISLAPWKHPETKYWKLMLPIYGIFLISVVGIVWLIGGPARIGLSGWSLLACLPLFLPFLTAGGRTWTVDGV
jgi:hypothetical protein